ncbi:MAG: hypothetical protein HY508_04090 [Acidobacteria bacterium]|nr:hypothetical protein [Acidobacteriota bacterium]
MWWDDFGFALVNHGDRYERLWWPLLRDEFPQYESFWRKHIIPLTNRIAPDIPPSDGRWIGFRDDPKINSDVEAMAQSHYSTFYFLARATLVIKYEPQLFFEDAFALLAAATANFERFVKVWHRRLVKRLALSKRLVPVGNVENRQVIKEIREYRNVLLHAPVLGRAHYLNSEFLPKKQVLKKVEESWRFASNLREESFEEGRGLLQRLRAGLLRELTGDWQKLETALDPARSYLCYRNCYNLDGNYCIPGKSQPDLRLRFSALDLSSPAASGTVVLSSATRVMSAASNPSGSAMLE